METQIKQDNYSKAELLATIRSLLFYVLKSWRVIMLFSVIGSALGLAYYFIQKPRYQAETTFILQEKAAGGGGIAGLASQFGINIGSLSSNGDIFSGDNILDILKSKKVVRQILLSPVDSLNPGGKTMADLYLEFTGLRKKWEGKGLQEVDFSKHIKGQELLKDSMLNVIYSKLIKENLTVDRARKQGSIIKVQVSARDNNFARILSERLVDEAGKMYIDVRVGTAQRNIDRLQKRSDSLLSLLNYKSYGAAASQLLDINPGLRSASVPSEIAVRDKTILSTLYIEVTKNLEASKLMLSQETPVIQLLDQPSLLMDNNKKGLFFCMVIAAIVAGILSSACIAALFFLFKPIKTY